MTPDEVYRCCEAVLGLPLPKQAVCVRLAAEVSAPLWRQWCERHRVQDDSGELLDTFDRWLSAAAADDELDRVANRFLATLPQDLREEEDPTGGYAGWSLLDIAVVALGQGEEVHHSILHTAICYAAAAHCRVRVGPTEVTWVRLTPAELAFVDQWWQRCCNRFPGLAGATVPAEPGAADVTLNVKSRLRDDARSDGP
jgi:hypothetical protein